MSFLLPVVFVEGRTFSTFNLLFFFIRKLPPSASFLFSLQCNHDWIFFRISYSLILSWMYYSQCSFLNFYALALIVFLFIKEWKLCPFCLLSNLTFGWYAPYSCFFWGGYNFFQLVIQRRSFRWPMMSIKRVSYCYRIMIAYIKIVRPT